jgi:hypothetical protein
LGARVLTTETLFFAQLLVFAFTPAKLRLARQNQENAIFRAVRTGEWAFGNSEKREMPGYFPARQCAFI